MMQKQQYPKETQKIIKKQQLFFINGDINIAYLKKVLEKEYRVDFEFLTNIIHKCRQILKYQPNLLYINDPVYVIGDIHGQYWDLLKILSLCPNLQENHQKKLLFLGDYVDRGINGTQVAILIIALKIKYPKQVYILRGNHQSRIMTQQLNFYKQFIQKYPRDSYFDLMDLFDYLPIACIINDRYFCVHGGISRDLHKLDNLQQLNKLERFHQIPLQGHICDFVWSDPIHDQYVNMMQTQADNTARGISIYFGYKICQQFLRKNKLHCVIRAHQLINKDGYKQHIWPGWKNHPSVLTIFSAPNYCGTYHNKAVILSIKKGKLQIRQFNQQQKIHNLSQNLNCFNITLSKLLTATQKFTRYLSRSYLDKLFPQFKSLKDSDKINLLIIAIEKLKNQSQKNKRINQIKNNNINDHSDLFYFQRSQSYYAQSQKIQKDKKYISAIIYNEN